MGGFVAFLVLFAALMLATMAWDEHVYGDATCGFKNCVVVKK
jgi:hypothetical protein